MNRIRGINFSSESAVPTLEPAGSSHCDAAVATAASTISLSKLSMPLAAAMIVCGVLSNTSAALAQDQKSESADQSKIVDSSVEKIVVTKAGDTFATLAFQEFGSVAMARLLSEYNKLSIKTVFEPGLEIIIPSIFEDIGFL